MANIVAAVPGIVDAVINIGWWVAGAHRVRDIVNRGMDIAEDRSKDCIKIFQNSVDFMLQKGGEVVDDWNKLALMGASTATIVCINHLVNKLSDESCEEDYFTLRCLAKSSFNVATAITSTALASVLALKATGLIKQNGSEKDVDLESREEPPKQLSTEKVYGVEDGIPYFLVNRLFEDFTLIEFNNPLNVKIHIKKDSLLIETPDRLGGNNSFYGKMSYVEIEDKSIAKASITGKNIRISPVEGNDNLKIQIIKYLCYPNQKLHVLEFEVHSEKKSRSTTIKIERDYDEFKMNFMKSEDNLANIREEINAVKRSREVPEELNNTEND